MRRDPPDEAGGPCISASILVSVIFGTHLKSTPLLLPDTNGRIQKLMPVCVQDGNGMTELELAWIWPLAVQVESDWEF